MLSGIFYMVGTVRNSPHWLFTPDQIDGAIGKPLANICNRHGIMTKVSEASDYIALTVGAVALFSPAITKELELKRERENIKTQINTISEPAFFPNI